MSHRQSLLFAALAIVAGCSDSAAPASSNAPLPDACGLITAAEVESLLGARVAPEPEGGGTAGGDSKRCTWKLKSSTEIRSDEIVLSIAPAAAYGPGALAGSTPYTIGDEGQLLEQGRGVQIAWKKGAYAATYRYAITGVFKDDFEPLRVKAKAMAGAVNGRL